MYAPRVVERASSRRVLTTEWVEGERLDRTSAVEDVPRLASLAMNSYMNMMLDSGYMHCDPHPGNLLRCAGWDPNPNVSQTRVGSRPEGSLQCPGPSVYILVVLPTPSTASHPTAPHPTAPHPHAPRPTAPHPTAPHPPPPSFLFAPHPTYPTTRCSTKDGALCILDWGLITRLDADLRLTFIEHVAHVVARDYEQIPADLVRLGFVPAGQEEAALSAGVVELLTYTYAKRAEGGGFANFDVPQLFEDLRELSAEAGSSIFQIPPYFAYIAKAFATLEGIGLSADPGYSIINETLPYISRRILTDPSPRTAGALETFVFGEESARAARVLNPDRVGTLLDGARRYAASADVVAAEGESATATTPSGASIARAELAADALLDLLSEDTPASRLVTEQLVMLLGASSRQIWSDLRARSGTLGGSRDGSGGGEARSGRMRNRSGAAPRSVLGVVLDPLGLWRESALINNDERDLAVLHAASKLTALATELLADVPTTDPKGGGRDAAAQSAGGAEGGSDEGSVAMDRQLLVRALATKAFERRADLRLASRRVAVEAIDQVTLRLSGQGRSGGGDP